MLEKLIELMKNEKWAFAAYTGLSTRKNTSRWHLVPGGLSWSTLRYKIECHGLEALESSALSGATLGHYDSRPVQNTMVVAYEAFRCMRKYTKAAQLPSSLTDLMTPETLSTKALPEKTLTGDCYVAPNTFLLLVRSALPLGGRPFVPLDQQMRWALVQDHLRYRPDDARLKQQLTEMQDDASKKVHAADRPLRVHTTELEWPKEKARWGPFGFEAPSLATRVTCTTPYLEPPSDYLCPECQTFGAHFKEACYLWPKEASLGPLSFGPKKFAKGLKQAAAGDAAFYSMLHKRSEGRHVSERT